MRVKARLPDGTETMIDSEELAALGPLLGQTRVAATIEDPFTGAAAEVWLRGSWLTTQALVETGDGVVGIVDGLDPELDGTIESTIDAMLVAGSDAAGVFDAAESSVLEARNRQAAELFTAELDRRLDHLGVSRAELT